MKPNSLSRRRFLRATSAVAVAGAFPSASAAQPGGGPHQATGKRVGEATDTSAIVWTRLTRNRERNNAGLAFNQKKVDRKNLAKVTVPVGEIEGACPGAPGRVRVRFGLRADLSDARETEWVQVGDSTDYIHPFALTGLKPGSIYHYVSQAAADAGGAVTSESRGRFFTAPAATTPTSLRFCVMTCQGYQDRDHADGHPIYPAMLALEPAFVVMTGDLVYYDSNEPVATTPELARLHWERMFSLPRQLAMMSSASSYWLKDDHDTLSNDTWPGRRAGDLTFAEGQKIFRQQAPLGADLHRTFRWGRDLQVWFTDGRDFRSPNTMPDGPGKTIWGAAQKEWFKRTVAASDATWKVLVSPTPLVGPDRATKNDNHSNAGFAHEGDELRGWLQANAPDNFFVICGDRHWQYHSVHPTTGVQEFSVGAASDSHAGGTPGENPAYHRFHRVKGGFLSVELKPEGRESRIALQLRDVSGAVVYEKTARRLAMSNP
ncbi:MAG: alkaline phosphatase [Verrucomicrobia bacterium]|nr:alkaline phosphatase [Verrucomicrobiota bacterium]